MKMQFHAILAVGIACAAMQLRATDGTLRAESGDSAPFAVYSVDGTTYSAATSAEIAALPPVFRRVGETVTATSPDGSVTTLDSSSLASILNAGGVWTLANSVQGSARIGVAWAVYGDGGLLASGAFADPYAVESKHAGPDRKVLVCGAPPVSYTGDNWIGDLAKASTVTFTPPEGSGLDATTLNLTGTGVRSFTFPKSGTWTVRLVEATTGTVRLAKISVRGGFTVIVF